MKKYLLSFADITFISKNIVEVIIHANTVISLEMAEEFDDLLSRIFKDDFALLINKINAYRYEFEVKTTVASHENLKAIAVINYKKADEQLTEEFMKQRTIDGWNVKKFSGLELGWQQGVEWLTQQLNSSD